MNWRYLFFYIGIAFWIFALISMVIHPTYFTVAFSVLALGSFLLHLLLHRIQESIFTMFGKNKTVVDVPLVSKITAAPVVKKEQPTEETQRNTMIASKTRFDGNIIATGHVYIYGEVYGNIDVSDGLVKVMQNGFVKGNITTGDLIIDGTTNGECHATSINIYDHGNVNGTLVYATLSIKEGGVFVGKAEHLSETKVIDTPAKRPMPSEMNIVKMSESPSLSAPKPLQAKKEAIPLAKNH
ncbi:polymer-forming cytoskeletal protein [Acerihabitans sp. TG2]|uniref:bactofilin family protein n=1 Tax=Acerihabitans sp. TG2 TaxID=3096008 RepID=UPI002B23DAA2|nr:polymer-forming cytoskeletal protein [Acerihabitans sp. TG2]MEA9389741.1 polymer-forming cytoskeletal protein [Acerihabitans sp. TG2]